MKTYKFILPGLLKMAMLLTLFFTTIIGYGQQNENKQQVCYKNTPITSILDSLSLRFNVNFSYNSGIPALKKEKNIAMFGSVTEILDSLLISEGLTHKVIDKQIVVYISDNEIIKNISNTNPEYINITGVVKDKEQNQALPYATIYLSKKSIGITTNSDGGFVFKVPYKCINDTLSISYIGYKSYKAPISSIINNKLDVKLELNRIMLPTVVIEPVNLLSIIKSVSENIENNYRKSPVSCTAFFRESTRENNEYINVCEAVIDVYKGAYNSNFDSDHAQIYKGRKSENVNKTSKLKYKFEGGITNCLMLDVVKDIASFLSPESFDNYDYKYEKMVEFENQLLYVISFDQKDNIEYPLFKGVIYIEKGTRALVAARFGLSPKGIKYAQSMLVKKYPRKLKIKPVLAEYMVNYRNINGKWYLEHVRGELQIKAKSEKLFVNSTYKSVCEMTITEIDTVNIHKIKWKDMVKPNDVLVENINSSYDELFWGKYNAIEPEEPVIEAIKKLNIKQGLVIEHTSFWDKLF